MKKVCQNIVLWIVSLSMLNTSINIDDEAFSYAEADSTVIVPDYDEIESITELVIDSTMDQSLPDQKGNEQDGMIKKTVSFDFFMPEKKQKIVFNIFRGSLTNKETAHYTLHLSPGYRTILTPPPNFATQLL